MAITLNLTPKNILFSRFDNSTATNEARSHFFVLDSYTNKTNPVLKVPVPPLLSTVLSLPQEAPVDSTTGNLPVCDPAINLKGAGWSSTDFTYKNTVSGQMNIPNIDIVIASLSNPKSTGFKQIYPGIMSDYITPNNNGIYTYYILDRGTLARTYIGQTVKITVTRTENDVTISWENYGPQPTTPDFVNTWIPLTFYTNYSNNKVTWTFSKIEGSSLYNVSCSVNSQSVFFQDVANSWMRNNEDEAKKQFNTKLIANFSAARSLFAAP